jgi:hypothetical protein
MNHYVNPINGAIKDSYVISGHRDYLATECPGENLYARLVELREETSSLLRRDNSADLLTFVPFADPRSQLLSGPA